MKNIKLALFRRLARYGHPLLKIPEKRQIARYGGERFAHPPVFIVGAPRSGSTLLYQMLTHRLDLLYIDNLSAMFYRDLLTGLWFSHKLYDRQPHHCFRSFLGITLECGPHAPAECGDFWYRWLPGDKHYIAADEIPRAKSDQIRDILSAATNRWDKPLLLKNLAMGQRMALIQNIAPAARFIFIRRNPLFNAQSIWLSRQQFGLEPHQWWSIKPENYSRLAQLDSHKQIAGQIFYLEKQILSDRRLFPPQQFKTVSYEQLCSQPEQTIDQLRQFIGEQLGTRQGDTSMPPLAFREKQKIADRDFNLLRKEIDSYDWENHDLH